MTTMKTCCRLATVAATLTLWTTWAGAAPSSTLSGSGYLVSAQQLSWLSVGGSIDTQNRRLTRGPGYTLERTRLRLQVGADATRWLSVYGFLGRLDDQYANFISDPARTEFGGGMQLRLLNHDIMMPHLSEDRLMLTSDLEYAIADETRREMKGQLLVSLINDINSAVSFQPDAVGLYAGPVYSDLQGSGIDEKKRLGAMVGMQVFFTSHLMFYVGASEYDRTTLHGGFQYNF